VNWRPDELHFLSHGRDPLSRHHDETPRWVDALSLVRHVTEREREREREREAAGAKRGEVPTTSAVNCYVAVRGTSCSKKYN
jgi:hypothetical protein